jgi:OOP family OmpA-OmpF porin
VVKAKVIVFIFILWGGIFLKSTFGMEQGPYVGINSSAVFVSEIDLNGAEFRSDTGIGVGLIGGYDFGRYRMEGEITYRRNNIDEIDIASWRRGAMGGDGDITSTSFMFNGYFDFENETVITPYAGVGIGIAVISFNDVSAIGIDLVDDDTSELAAQLAVGFSYTVSDLVMIDLGYRYFFTDEMEFENEFGNDIGDESYDSHNIMVGLRVTF